VNSRPSDSESAVDPVPTRGSLIGRLRDWRDDRSWQEFYETYWRLIHRTALHAGLSAADADEVVQETLVSAAKAMPGFRYDPNTCSFKSWLRYLTRCRIADHFRRQGRRVATFQSENEDTGTGLMERQVDPRARSPENEWDAEWEQNLLEAALDRVKARVQPAQFQMFQLCFLKGQPPREVARSLEVGVARVYMAKHRVAAMLKEEVARLRNRWS